jgi:hypothetical protein
MRIVCPDASRPCEGPGSCARARRRAGSRQTGRCAGSCRSPGPCAKARSAGSCARACSRAGSGQTRRCAGRCGGDSVGVAVAVAVPCGSRGRH